jgi:acetylglutamate kinase
LSNPAPPHRTLEGALVDLGRVGEPIGNGDSRLLRTLLDGGFVPVIASIGMDQGGQLLNVNADTLASHVAGTLKASRLAIGGTTAGVLDQAGATIRDLDTLAIERLVGSGTATAGMIAKLRACERAVAAGVDDVVVFDARDAASVNLVVEGAVPTSATRIAAAAAATRH